MAVARQMKRFHQVLDLVGSSLFLLLFITILLQVFSRYVLNEPLGWTTEISVIAYLWLVFWGAAFMVGHRDQVRFDLIYNHLPSSVQRVMAITRSLIIIGTLLFALPANFDYIKFMEYDTTGVLEIGFDQIFAIFLIFLAALLVRNLYRSARLLGKKWRDEL